MRHRTVRSVVELFCDSVFFSDAACCMGRGGRI